MKKIILLSLASVLLNTQQPKAQMGIMYQSYNYYGNGITEYLFLGFMTGLDQVKYSTSAKPMKETNLKIVRYNAKDNEATVRFPNSNVLYRLKIVDNILWCIYPDGKKQLYVGALGPEYFEHASYNFHRNRITEFLAVIPRGYQQKNKYLYYTKKSKNKPIELVVMKETKDGTLVGATKYASVRFPGSSQVYQLDLTSDGAWYVTHPNGQRQTFITTISVTQYASYNFYKNGGTEYLLVSGLYNQKEIHYFSTFKPNPIKLIMVKKGQNPTIKFPNDATLYKLRFYKNTLWCDYPDGKKQKFVKVTE